MAYAPEKSHGTKGVVYLQEEPEKRSRIPQSALFRAGFLLFVVVTIFLLIRQAAVPKSFGQYGYYRGDNVEEWVSLPQNFAQGNPDCTTCHQPEVLQTGQSAHSQMDCQSCHGPLLTHVKNPKQPLPKVIGNAELCGACHRELIGRARDLVPTVKLGQHSGGLDCSRCHDPHKPLPTKGGSNL